MGGSWRHCGEPRLLRRCCPDPAAGGDLYPMPALRFKLRATAIVAFVVGLLASAAPAQAGCDRYVNASGSLQRFVASLHPGQTGCLHGGTYDDGDLTFPHGGHADAPLTLS